MSRVVRIVCAVFAAAALVLIIERAGTDPERVPLESRALHVEAAAPRSWESAHDASRTFATAHALQRRRLTGEPHGTLVRRRDLFLSGNCMACHPMSGRGAPQTLAAALPNKREHLAAAMRAQPAVPNDTQQLRA
jgi:hypothetical protein